MGRLEYLEVYDVVLGKRECKGIYLGESKIREELKKVILVDLSSRAGNRDFFQLRKFDKFYFTKGKLHFRKNYTLKIPSHQRGFYKELLEEKLQ